MNQIADQSRLAAALDFAAKGWAVFPLRGKIPLLDGGRGHLDATTDPRQIALWWGAAPWANVGAAVPESLLALDVDPRNGGEPDALSLPPTLTVWSGRGDGGRHFYFRRPPGHLTGLRLPAGWDLKVKGYCVVPPSTHPDSGQPYTWECSDAPALLPSPVRELLRPPPRPPRGRPVRPKQGTGGALVRFVAKQPEGNRNKALYWAACRAAEQGLLDRIAQDLVDAAVEVGLPEQLAAATVASAGRKAPRG